MNDEDYLALLYKHLPAIIDSFQPDFAFYISGVDIIATDRFGKLNVSMEEFNRRDDYAFGTRKK